MIAEVSSVQCSFSRPVFPFICLFINSKIYLTFLCNFNPHIVKLALNWNRVKASVGILDFCLLSFISPHFACWLGGFCCVLCSDPITQLTDVVRSLIFWSALHFKKCSSEWCCFLVHKIALQSDPALVWHAKCYCLSLSRGSCEDYTFNFNLSPSKLTFLVYLWACLSNVPKNYGLPFEFRNHFCSHLVY